MGDMDSSSCSRGTSPEAALSLLFFICRSRIIQDNLKANIHMHNHETAHSDELQAFALAMTCCFAQQVFIYRSLYLCWSPQFYKYHQCSANIAKGALLPKGFFMLF